MADAEYWYQYDAFGRLASVHGRGDLTFLSSGTVSGGTPGAWRLYLAYDGLGRLIREQKPWEGGTDHRQAWFYYDGVRRISEVFKDPIVGAAMPLGAAPGGGYTTYTEREYVWGPDYVDECLWQVTRPGGVLHTLQDASKDVVALLDEAGAVARQYSYDAYGQVQFEDVFGTPAYSRLGHHGLFFDRLDVDAPAVELGVGARGLYHNRNRTYDPGTGRFTTSDPNGMGMPLLAHAKLGGALRPDLGAFDALGVYGDGMNLYGYLGSGPGLRTDAMGLFLGYDDLVMWGFGTLRGGMEEMVGQYHDNMYADIEWAMDWDMGDDWHTRNDNSWVNVSFALGAYRGLMEEVESSFMIREVTYAGLGKAGKSGKRLVGMVMSMRQLNQAIIHKSYSAAKSVRQKAGWDGHSHHLAEQQIGKEMPWRKKLNSREGMGPAINIDAPSPHLTDMRGRFDRAYENLGYTRGTAAKLNLKDAEQVIKQVYWDAPRLRNATLKYLRGR